MPEAFGDKAMMNLRFMFHDVHIPTDDTGFREFLNRHFLRIINLFSDIRAATAKVSMKSLATAPLTLESLYAYLSAYCTALVPFSDDLLTQASDMDCQKSFWSNLSLKNCDEHFAVFWNGPSSDVSHYRFFIDIILNDFKYCLLKKQICGTSFMR